MLYCRVCRNVTVIDFSPSLVPLLVLRLIPAGRHALAE